MYLRTDTRKDAVNSLLIAHELAVSVISNEQKWKWLVVAVHSGVQGFMVLALERGNALLTLRKDVAKKWLKAYSEDKEYPEGKLDYFLELYEKIKSDAVEGLVDSSRFTAEPRHDASMERLNRWRNDFIHFTPKGWSIPLLGLAGTCLDCLDVVEHLGWKSNTFIWYEEPIERKAAHALAGLRQELENLKKYYELES
jgi:uncharacterized protein (DUF3820 family)